MYRGEKHLFREVRGRPVCVILLVVVMVIIFSRSWLVENGKREEYRGEEKKLLCQLEALSGVDSDLSLVVTDVTVDGEPFADCVKIYGSGETNLFQNARIGNILMISGAVYSFQEPGNPGQFNEKKYYREMGIDYKVFARSMTIVDKKTDILAQTLQNIRNAFYDVFQKCLPENEAGTAAAMVLGEKCGLSEKTKELYQENGIAHLLAISGLHVSILGAGIFFFLRRFLLPMKPAALFSGVLLLMYGALTGFPISTRRAVLMMLCVLAARFMGKRYDRLCALSFAALVQLVIEPLSLFQTGFLLSYGTVLGISIFLDGFAGEKEAGRILATGVKSRIYKAKRGMEESFFSSLGIFLVTQPVLLYFYYEISPYSVLANMLVLPVLGALLVLAVSGGIVSFILPVAGRFLFGTVYFILQYYEWICRLFERLPGYCLIVGFPGMGRVVFYYILMILWRGIQNGRKTGKPGGHRKFLGETEVVRDKKSAKFILVLAVLVLVLPGCRREKLQITNLDVGQGDCTVIQTEGKAILIDGGSSDVSRVGKYRISKYLKYYGIRKLDYIFITHSDNDHVSGVLEMIQESDHMGIEIGSVVLPEINRKDEGYEKLEDMIRASNTALKKMEMGDELRLGEVSLRCLHPMPDYDWKSENDYSLVILLKYREFQGIFTGDLEEAGESAVLDSVGDVDYLKVGHHGSKGASSEKFLDKIKPETAVISAGERNRYGHPHTETLERLKAAGARIYSTVEMGAVTVRVSGDGYEVEGYKR